MPRHHSGEDSLGLIRRAVVRLVLTGILLFVVGLVLGLALIHRHGGGPIQSWDNTVQSWSFDHPKNLVGVSKFIATWLDAAPLAVIAVVLTIIWLAVGRCLRGLIPIIAYLGGEGMVFVIREIIHRHRPPTANYPAPHAIAGVHETSWSYPSGHAVAVSAVLFACLGAYALAHRTWWPWLVALLASCFVADTRLVLGVHWFSDVGIGLLLGIPWGITVAAVGRTLPSWGFVVPRRRAAVGDAQDAAGDVYR